MFRLLFLTLFSLALLPACSPPKKSKRPGTSSVKPKPQPKPQPAPTPYPPAPVLTQEGSANIQWLVSDRLMPVLEEAQRVNKPVFVEFFADWCAPCKVMEEEVFTQATVYQFFNNNFLNFRTDYDASNGRTIADLYDVKALPTVLYLNPQGVVLARQTGGLSGTKLRELGNQALAKMKN